MHCLDFYCTCFFCLTSSCSVLFHLYCGTDVCTIRMQLFFGGEGGIYPFLVTSSFTPHPHPTPTRAHLITLSLILWWWSETGSAVYGPLYLLNLLVRALGGTIHLFLPLSFPSSFSPPPFPSYSPPLSSSSCSPLPLLTPPPPLRPDITVMVDWAYWYNCNGWLGVLI